MLVEGGQEEGQDRSGEERRGRISKMHHKVKTRLQDKGPNYKNIKWFTPGEVGQKEQDEWRSKFM